MATARPSFNDDIAAYLQQIDEGEIQSCKDQIALAAYVRRCFENEQLFVDDEKIESCKAISKYFFEELLPWEAFVLSIAYTYNADGDPRWPDLVIFIGRGNGKDRFIAFLSFCFASGINGIEAYDVDICANSEEQAKRPFDDAWTVLENDAGWAKSWRWTRSAITSKSTGSTIKYRANSPKSRDGMRSGFCIFNEVHAYETWANITVFTTGMGKVRHGRRAFISSNGHIRDGVYDSLLERCEAILNEGREDNGYFPFICKLDDADEVHNEESWVKANPSLPWLPDLSAQIRKEYADWKDNPIESPDFMTKRMGLAQGNIEQQVTDWENLLAASRDLPDLRGEVCVCGIDFARTTDFVSCGLLFHRDDEWYWLSHHWFCAESRDRSRIKPPLEEWDEQGIITIVEDTEIHPSIVTDWIYEQAADYDIAKVAIDDYRYTIMMRELRDIGFSVDEKTVQKIRPSDHMKVYSLIESAFNTQSIAWGENPAMRWFTNNVKITPFQNGNYKFEKIDPQRRKTDGFMALAAAFAISGAIPDSESHDDGEVMAPITF